MEATKKKRQKTKNKAQNLEEKRDYFTELPKPLLHNILSYLEMKDVIRTSVLAKRWKHVWFFVPCLNFSLLKRPKYKEVAFINRTLLLYKGPKIQKLNITLTYSKADAHRIDSWVHFASAHNVNEISLDLDFYKIWRDNPLLDIYKVPHFIFSSTSLTVLTLVRCVIVFPINYRLSSLKILSLEEVYFSSGAIMDLISSSPILEFLSLTDCETFRDLDLFIFQKGLKTLKIHEYDYRSSSSSLSVSAPYVKSFELISRMYRKYYFIHDIQSLHSATFFCDELHCPYNAVKERFIFKIFDAVQHVKDLRFCSCYIESTNVQALSRRRREEQSAGCPSFDLTCLRLKTELTSKELPGIAYMLRHSPNIETLIISIDKNLYNEMDVDHDNADDNVDVGATAIDKDGESYELDNENAERGENKIMEATKKKRPKTKKKAKNLEEKRDYFTELSEPLLHNILSYLEMKGVIRTSVLAKRWKHVWFFVPCLNFSLLERPKYKEVAFINRTLLLYKGPKIQKLNITFTYSKADADHIDSWIHFASAHNLYIADGIDTGKMRYSVPDYKLSSLKILSLEEVYFSSGAIKDLISSSPILDFLSLTNCEKFRNLDLFIFKKGLKTLKIHEYDYRSSSSILSVSARYVNSFELVTSLSNSLISALVNGFLIISSLGLTSAARNSPIGTASPSQTASLGSNLRIYQLKQRNLLLLRALQWRLLRPRPRHRRRREQQERRLEYGDGLRLGGLGVAELELEGCAGEEIRHAGLDDDDGAVAVRRDDSVFDWFVVFGAVVVGFEGGGAGLRFWGMRMRVFPGF
ncbi:RNA-binding CRS1 / YhbY (CRM) domain-containing protein [Actinidia rufa]|uniref:RNA-binding CRS1 / YhbY (CRM) domain-containing protein n=1 Tax=Actinidia rufa TaxID=165716 RepID=A0A7J0G6S0_9ERIC|nr:RNA-binding CRS1 / YhbY (CRM) domain-containing protein [Actinidia rufa]